MSRLPSLLVLLSIPGLLAAQQRAPAAKAIAPGMTRAEVVEQFGAPFLTKSGRDSVTYLYYANGRERRVGMHDLVVLKGDVVIDAVLRSPQRRYGGESSSPKALTAQAARPTGSTTP